MYNKNINHACTGIYTSVFLSWKEQLKEIVFFFVALVLFFPAVYHKFFKNIFFNHKNCKGIIATSFNNIMETELALKCLNKS